MLQKKQDDDAEKKADIKRKLKNFRGVKLD
jgi:hypothetical protein